MNRVGPVLLAFAILRWAAFGQNGGEEKVHVPKSSCWDPAKQNGFPDESLRSEVLAAPDGRHRAYAQVDSRWDRDFEQPCRTHTMLLLKSGRSPFRTVYEQRTSKEDPWYVSLGPVAWSPDSRWLVVEEWYDQYASDAGGADILLLDAVHGTTRRDELYTAVASHQDKHCEIEFPRFKAFDRRSRLLLQVWERVELGGDATNCVIPGEQWLFDPVSGQAKRVHRR